MLNTVDQPHNNTGEKERKVLEKIVSNAEERKKLLAEEHKPQALGKNYVE